LEKKDVPGVAEVFQVLTGIPGVLGDDWIYYIR